MQGHQRQLGSAAKRWIIGLSLLTFLGLGCHVALHMLQLPDVATLLSLYLSPPSKSNQYFSGRTISASASPRALGSNPLSIDLLVDWRDGELLSLNEFLQATHTNAIIILSGNDIVLEEYFNGYKADFLFPSFSVSKAILATLTGIAISEKKLPSLNDDIRPYLQPEIREKLSVPVRTWDLLNMRAGIAVKESYESFFSKVVEMYLSTDLKKFIAGIPSSSTQPGAAFEYRSVEYLLLGSVLTQATNQSLSAYLESRLWQPMGAKYDATWSVDSAKSGIEKAFCCISAQAVDYARFGLLYLNHGKRDERQIIPSEWVEHARTSTGRSGKLAYSHGWWMLNDSKDRDFSAIGIYGQYIYVNPSRQIVIVKLSDHGMEEDEEITLRAFQKIANYVHAKTLIPQPLSSASNY